MIIIAWNSDRLMERRWHVCASASIAACGLLASAFLHDPTLSLCALSVAAFGIWGTVGPFWSLPTASLSPAAAAAGIGLINSVGNLGGFAGPYIVGLVKESTHNFTYALAAMALSLIIAGTLAVAATRPDPSPDPRSS
jgi:ACS family tartrate transporter-like MFS transporter